MSKLVARVSIKERSDWLSVELDKMALHILTVFDLLLLTGEMSN